MEWPTAATRVSIAYCTNIELLVCSYTSNHACALSLRTLVLEMQELIGVNFVHACRTCCRDRNCFTMPQPAARTDCLIPMRSGPHSAVDDQVTNKTCIARPETIIRTGSTRTQEPREHQKRKITNEQHFCMCTKVRCLGMEQSRKAIYGRGA